MKYADQLRALSHCLEHGEDIHMMSVVVALQGAAEKIDYLGKLLDDYSNVTLEN